MAMTKLDKAIKGLKACSLDKDVTPNCKDCPYSYEGSKCENNRTGERCCNELKEDLNYFLNTIPREQENTKPKPTHYYGAWLCPKCGFEVHRNWMDCHRCGTKLNFD